MRVHDVVGIGIGPFNLGPRRARARRWTTLDAVFLDAADEFRWHPGMMIEGATIQVPFLADLVSMADPTSPYSFLNHLKATGRLYPFYIRESFYPLRAEYDAYCRWVAAQLPSLRWGRRVVGLDAGGRPLRRHAPTRRRDVPGQARGARRRHPAACCRRRSGAARWCTAPTT